MTDSAPEGSGAADDDTTSGPNPFACVVQRPFPYPSGIPYVGIHAEPGNSDFVPCDTAPAFVERWHVLEGFGVAQPNTFSPDGDTIYVTSSNPQPDDCTVHALDATTGEARWCLAVPRAIATTVEVDADGNLFMTSDADAISLDADGSERWRTAMPAASLEGQGSGAVGLHLTPRGNVATVTDGGVVVLLDRMTGATVATLDIPATHGFVAPATLDLPLDASGLVPDAVAAEFDRMQHGDDDGGLLGGFLGAGGEFSANTVAVTPQDTIYAIGGGATPEAGALVQVRIEGDGDSVTLSPGWVVHTVGGSAASPSVSPDGRWVSVSDGSTATSFIDPQSAEAHAYLVDIAACDANTDGDDEPGVCAPARAIPLLSGPSAGSQPLLDGPKIVLWEVQAADILNSEGVDLHVHDDESLRWQTVLPDDLQWTSVITVSNNHLIGTATRFEGIGANILTVDLPNTAASELIVLDRADGSVVFRAPVTDDATSTVTIGPSGELYVTMLGLMHILAVETRFVGGVIRFDPVGP